MGTKEQKKNLPKITGIRGNVVKAAPPYNKIIMQYLRLANTEL